MDWAYLCAVRSSTSNTGEPTLVSDDEPNQQQGTDNMFAAILLVTDYLAATSVSNSVALMTVHFEHDADLYPLPHNWGG